MRPVSVLIFHACAPRDAGPNVRALAEARHSLANRQLNRWLAAGADEAKIVAGPPDGLSFGERLAAEVRALHGGGPEGLIVLGSGSIPLGRVPDLRRFVAAAAGPGGHALANNRYSADVVALSRASDLAGLPPLPADNALPRWLEELAGVMVTDLRRHWRLGVDVDTPLDLIVLGLASADALHGLSTPPLIGERLAALGDVLANKRAELLVAGRVSASTLSWLEHGVACRVRALVEERGLRAASRLARSNLARSNLAQSVRDEAEPRPEGKAHATASPTPRPPRSVLGELLDRDGPESLARHVAALADAAVIDTRVLMAHRSGAVDSGWPPPEDRFASDLLDAASVADPWLAALTTSAAGAPPGHPIVLGGHTLVNGGLRLLAQRARAVAR
jgi:hypothetical protein